MSTIAVSPAATGAAQFTIASPATATNRVLTLPDQTATLATATDVSAGDAAVTATMLGIGQTWQDVTASRTNSTSYQNLTARPIMVSVKTSNTATAFQVSTNNSTWVEVGANSGSTIGSLSFIVPPNHYYRFNGAGTISNWAELR